MKKTVQTGTLELIVEKNLTGMDEKDVFDIASRSNPKRGFLIVSKLIGRHIPTRPSIMRNAMKKLAAEISPDLPGPVLFLGMAETAVGLGQGVHQAWQDQTGRNDVYFIQSTRQTHEWMSIWAAFEEGHSHASSHLVHKPEDLTTFESVRSLVIVDDECSTGTTFIKVEEAMREVLPNLEQVVDVVITEWAKTPGRQRVSLVSGTLRWEPNGLIEKIPGENANRHGKTNPKNSSARVGYRNLPVVNENSIPSFEAGTRVTVIADGENAYNALCVAEKLEEQGAITALQSITRSPAHVGEAMTSRAILSDSHGSGATCYSYNLEQHNPDVIIVVTETPANQHREISKSTGLAVEKIHLVEILR